MDDQQPDGAPLQTPNPAPQTPVAAPPSPPAPQPELTNSVKVALLVFALAGAFVLGVIPHLSTRTSGMPPFRVFLLSGLVMVLLTALLFSVLSRLSLGFGKTALVMAFGYNAVIAVIKFVLSPRALYLSNQHNPFNTQGGDPNTFFYYDITGAVILLLYVGVFWLMYRHFRRRIMGPAGQTVQHRHRVPTQGVALFSLGVVGLFAVGGIVTLIPLFLTWLFLGSSVTYLGYVFGALGVPLVVAIALAIVMAYRGFAAVEKQIIVSGNSALLASFLWLGVSLIVLYHVLWVVFMLTLVHIWPFNTYSPK